QSTKKSEKSSTRPKEYRLELSVEDQTVTTIVSDGARPRAVYTSHRSSLASTSSHDSTSRPSLSTMSFSILTALDELEVSLPADDISRGPLFVFRVFDQSLRAAFVSDMGTLFSRATSETLHPT